MPWVWAHCYHSLPLCSHYVFFRKLPAICVWIFRFQVVKVPISGLGRVTSAMSGACFHVCGHEWCHSILRMAESVTQPWFTRVFQNRGAKVAWVKSSHCDTTPPKNIEKVYYMTIYYIYIHMSYRAISGSRHGLLLLWIDGGTHLHTHIFFQTTTSLYRCNAIYMLAQFPLWLLYLVR